MQSLAIDVEVVTVARKKRNREVKRPSCLDRYFLVTSEKVPYDVCWGVDVARAYPYRLIPTSPNLTPLCSSVACCCC